MKLTQQNKDLSGRNGAPLRRLSIDDVQVHNTESDCWTIYNNKVYNISQYIHYHPGGIPKIMLGAGKDCSELFRKYHAWVNIESMLEKCCVGVIMPDVETIEEEEELDQDSVENKS